MEYAFADKIVRSWESAWNAHDVDAVLAHFHDDATFASPVVRHLTPFTCGVVVGKRQIREYWNKALALTPDLRFSVVRYFMGIDAIVIQYKNQRDALVSEILIFRGNLVISGFGTYGPEDSNPTGLVRDDRLELRP